MKNVKKIYPKKSLGQNFLINTGIQQKIVDVCHLKKTDIVLEVGPGKGVLTKLIASKVERVIAIEKDRDLAAQLKEDFKSSNVEVVCDDILDFNFNKLPKACKLIGNLPYNIATPIIEKAIMYRQMFNGLFVMVQLEHGKRMTASPGTKDYGSLSCFIQMYTDAKILFNISPGSFYPAPKVQSCFMQISTLPNARFEGVDENYLFEFIKLGFGQRRKTLLNALKNLEKDEELAKILMKLGINQKARAEELKLQDFVNIMNLLVKK